MHSCPVGYRRSGRALCSWYLAPKPRGKVFMCRKLRKPLMKGNLVSQGTWDFCFRVWAVERERDWPGSRAFTSYLQDSFTAQRA